MVTDNEKIVNSDMYSFSFKTILEDDLKLQLVLTLELKELLKKVCVSSEEKVDFNYNGLFYKRFLVKRGIINSLYSDEKELLFSEELLSTGSLKLIVSDLDDDRRLRVRFKDMLVSLIRLILACNVTETINLNIKTPKAD